MKVFRPADNPFASHRIEALAFRHPEASLTGILSRIDALGGRAAIIGTDGSGKTTLLHELAGRFDGGAVTVRLPGSCPVPWRTAREQLPQNGGAGHRIFVDGCEQLGNVGWRRLRYATRRAEWLVVTLHRPGRLPTLVECRTDVHLLRELVEELAPDETPELEPALAELFERHRGNIRLCLRELYDVCAGRLGDP
jgi:hypothetical protein